MINPTFAALLRAAHVRIGLRPRRLNQLVQADIEAPAPPDPETLRGVQWIASLCAPEGRPRPYFVGPTAALLAASLLVALLAALLWGLAPMRGSIWVVAGTAALMLESLALLYRAVTLQVPSHIGASRLQQAIERPQRAGDAEHSPLSILAWTGVMLVILVDAALAGVSIATAALGSVLSAEQALIAALAWSACLGLLLAHLTQAAAREAAIASRRIMIRALLNSPLPHERERGQRMVDEVGQALQHRFEAGANRTRARWLLALVVLGLAAAVFVARILSESAPAESGTLQPPAPAQWGPDGAQPRAWRI